MEKIIVLILVLTISACSNINSNKEEVTGHKSNGIYYRMVRMDNDSSYQYYEYNSENTLLKTGTLCGLQKIGKWIEYYPDGEQMYLIEDWKEASLSYSKCDNIELSVSWRISPSPDKNKVKINTDYYIKPNFINIHSINTMFSCSNCSSCSRIYNSSNGLWKVTFNSDNIGKQTKLILESTCEGVNKVLISEEFMVE